MKAIFFLLLLTATSAKAQLKFKVDTFSGDTTWYTVQEKLYSKPSMTGIGELMKVTGFRTGPVTAIGLWILSQKTIIDGYGSVLFKLESKKVVQIDSAVVSSSFVPGGNSATVILTEKENSFEDLSREKITDVRIVIDGKVFDYQIKEKQASAVMDALKLVRKP